MAFERIWPTARLDHVLYNNYLMGVAPRMPIYIYIQQQTMIRAYYNTWGRAHIQ